jgi:hypothetical protein
MSKERITNKLFGGLDWLLLFIFKTVYTLWKRHEGEVPKNVLAELDEHWDWPRGTASRAIERLNGDRKLTEQLEQHFASYTDPHYFYLGVSR